MHVRYTAFMYGTQHSCTAHSIHVRYTVFMYTVHINYLELNKLNVQYPMYPMSNPMYPVYKSRAYCRCVTQTVDIAK